MAYKYHNVVGTGDVHRPDDIEYANQAARLAGAGITSDQVGHLVQQTDNESFWRVTGSGPATFSAFTPPAPAVGDIGKSLVVESDGAAGVRFAYDAGGSYWQRAGTVLSSQTAGDTLSMGVGAVGAPSYAFEGDLTTGIYRSGASEVSIALGGVQKAALATTGLTLADNISLTGGGTITAGVGALSLTAGSASDFTVTGDNLTLATATSGDIIVTSIDLMDINAGNDLDVDVTGNTAIDSTGTIEWSGTNASLSSAGIMSLLGTGSQIVLESHTNTSGNVVSIKSTPGSSSTAKLMVLHADGTNWSSGSRVLEIISDDPSCYALTVNNGSIDTLFVDKSGNMQMNGNIYLASGGSIESTSNGDVSIVPNGTGVFMCGTGSPSHLTPTSGEAYFQGAVEFDSPAYFDGLTYFYSNTNYRDNISMTLGNIGDATLLYATAQSPDSLVLGVSAQSNALIICEKVDVGTDFGNALRTDPTTIHQSADATEVTERSYNSWNEQTIGGGKGSYCGLKSTTEEITIPVGQGGLGKKVDSSANLVPATSRIIQVVSRVTQAPGGGATTLDIGRTSGGNIDEYADATAVALGSTTIASDDGDGNTAIPHWQTSADTMQVGTDFDVTGTDMKIRVVVFYEEITVPTA